MKSLFNSILNKVMALPIWLHAVLLAASIIWFQWIKGKLDASYADSNHPVDYFTGQTSFSGSTIKSYYQTMLDAGSLDIYKLTQIIDFGFIAAIILIGIFMGTLIMRFAKPNGIARKAGFALAAFLTIGGLCDAIENLISFVMLANPLTFSDWLAIPYSGFAAIKFACITLGMLAFVISIVFLLVEKLKRN